MEDEFAFADASMVVAVEIVVNALTVDVVRACSMIDDTVVVDTVVAMVVDTVVADDSVVAADYDEDNCSTVVET